MKTLYLHIGMSKTATSSIQKFLMLNRAVLEQHGYCSPALLHKYADVREYRNGHFLVGRVFRKDGSKNRSLAVQYFREGMAQIWDCFERFDNIVLSEETIWRHFDGSHKQLFPYLIKDAAAHDYQIKIIVYLRRQDEFQISNWNERVKHSKHAMTLTFEERLLQVVNEESRILDYAARIDEIAGFFGKENIIVRRFEPDSWINGSIIDDFMHCIGLEITDDFLPLPQDVNPGLYGNTVEIKRIINKNTSFTRKENVFLGDILKELSVECGKQYPCTMLSPEETRSYLSLYEEGNAYVAETYIGDGKPLFSDRVKELPKWQADNPYMTEDIIRFFSAVSIDLRRENKQVRSELSELRGELSELRGELSGLQGELNSLQSVIENEQQHLSTFKDKLKHPLHTILNRLLHRKSQCTA